MDMSLVPEIIVNDELFKGWNIHIEVQKKDCNLSYQKDMLSNILMSGKITFSPKDKPEDSIAMISTPSREWCLDARRIQDWLAYHGVPTGMIQDIISEAYRMIRHPKVPTP